MAKEMKDLYKLEVKVSNFVSGPEKFMPCDSVAVKYLGKTYRISGDLNGIKIHSVESMLSVRPVVANQVIISQSDLYPTEDK